MVTITDVAKQAGVSPVTVSRVVNNTDYVSAKTREKVEKAIVDLGYIPSAMARGLRINRTYTLALILPDITNVFWTTVARGAEDAAQINNYSVLFYNVDEDLKKQERALDTVLSQQVDGVMIAPHEAQIKQLHRLLIRDVPVVVVDRRLDVSTAENSIDFVRSDSVSGAKALTEHLIHLGHRKIAMLSGNPSTSTAEDRLLGYRLALEEAGIAYDEQLVLYKEYRVASGEQLAHQLLERQVEFTAVFAGNNAIGTGAVRELLRREFRIPEDVALVAFDDYQYAGEYFPFFTVVAQDAYQLGFKAVELLMARIKGEHQDSQEIILPSQLVVRYSCGARIDSLGHSALSLPLVPVNEFKELRSEIDPLPGN